MKRCFTICVITILLLVTTACNTANTSFESEIDAVVEKETDNYETFRLDDYSEQIETFSAKKKLTSVATAKEAKTAALKLWVESFGDAVLADARAPRKVYFDSENAVWLITDSLEDNVAGGQHYALIRTDGTVLALWGTK